MHDPAKLHAKLAALQEHGEARRKAAHDASTAAALELEEARRHDPASSTESESANGAA